jgi:hypothetical protein
MGLTGRKIITIPNFNSRINDVLRGWLASIGEF